MSFSSTKQQVVHEWKSRWVCLAKKTFRNKKSIIFAPEKCIDKFI